MTAGNRYCQETRRRPVGWPGHPLHPILPVTATHPIPRKLGAHSSSQAQTIQSSLPGGQENLPVLWLRCPPSLTIVQLTPGVGVPRSPTPSSKHSGNFYCRKEADRGAARNLEPCYTPWVLFSWVNTRRVRCAFRRENSSRSHGIGHSCPCQRSNFGEICENTAHTWGTSEPLWEAALGEQYSRTAPSPSPELLPGTQTCLLQGPWFEQGEAGLWHQRQPLTRGITTLTTPYSHVVLFQVPPLTLGKLRQGGDVNKKYGHIPQRYCRSLIFLLVEAVQFVNKRKTPATSVACSETRHACRLMDQVWTFRPDHFWLWGPPCALWDV